MSDYQQFLLERDQIDLFIQQGYKIKMVTENLDGATVEFEKSESSNGVDKKETLRIFTPNGRKYFSVRLMQQK